MTVSVIKTVSLLWKSLVYATGNVSGLAAPLGVIHSVTGLWPKETFKSVCDAILQWICTAFKSDTTAFDRFLDAAEAIEVSQTMCTPIESWKDKDKDKDVR
jgi:hypothetical protein